MDNEPIESAHDAARAMAHVLLDAGFPPSAVVRRVSAAYGLPEVVKEVLAEMKAEQS